MLLKFRQSIFAGNKRQLVVAPPGWRSSTLLWFAMVLFFLGTNFSCLVVDFYGLPGSVVISPPPALTCDYICLSQLLWFNVGQVVFITLQSLCIQNLYSPGNQITTVIGLLGNAAKDSVVVLNLYLEGL